LEGLIKQGLSRGSIIDADLDLLDEVSVEIFTVGRLARQLSLWDGQAPLGWPLNTMAKSGLFQKWMKKAPRRHVLQSWPRFAAVVDPLQI
jgi:hypothetical protein